MISILGIETNGVWELSTTQKAAAVIKEIYGQLVGALRELDLVGTLGTLDNTVPFIVLPMTDGNGCLTVRKRLETTLEKSVFVVKGNNIQVKTVISCIASDSLKNINYKKFLELVKSTHTAEENTVKNIFTGSLQKT
jgi:hypothetical protein